MEDKLLKLTEENKALAGKLKECASKVDSATTNLSKFKDVVEKQLKAVGKK